MTVIVYVVLISVMSALVLGLDDVSGSDVTEVKFTDDTRG